MSGLQPIAVVYHAPMAGENPDFIHFVTSLSCRMGMHDPCEGDMTAHRTGAEDADAIPLCCKHRRALALGTRPFSTSAEGRRNWEIVQVKWVRAQWLGAS